MRLLLTELGTDQYARHLHGTYMAPQVSVELDGEAFKVTVPMASVVTRSHLKLKIAQAILASLGTELTPRSWAAGDVRTMAVQFLDQASGAPLTVKDTTDLQAVYASRTLRATQQKQRSHSMDFHFS